jgi:phosphatidylserine/phosphatidylglycerophosphate/cardiolipin synthase-like enzyme
MKLSAKVLPGLLPLFMAGLLTGLAHPVFAKHGSFGGSVMEALDEVVQGRESTSLPSHGTVEIAFSPNGACTAATVRFIGEAKHSIRLAAYGLTSSPIGQALVEAKKRGVDVRIVVDREHNGRRNTPNSVASFLASNGILVRVDTAVRIQHNKVLIVDEKSVQNGSFNFTNAAQTSNAENIIIHRDFPELAKLFTRNWDHLWTESNEFRAAY